jgi:hypothetical protein
MFVPKELSLRPDASMQGPQQSAANEEQVLSEETHRPASCFHLRSADPILDL